MKLNLDPDPGGQSGGGTDWRAALPEDIRSSPSIAKFKGIDDLAKSYISAESMIGTKRLEQPQPNWDDKKWESFYAAAGRPETPDKYGVPDFKFEEGLEIQPELLEKAKMHFHKFGLSDKQAKGVLEYYFSMENERFKGSRAATASETAAAEEAMKKQFGKDYDVKLGQAKALIQRFDEDGTLVKFLNESKLGNDSRMLRFLATVADKFKEDSTGTTTGLGMALPTKEKAKLDIAQMKSDKEFMTKWLNGDQWAKQRWEELHRLAYPPKES